jgi:general secretion pathway protein B
MSYILDALKKAEHERAIGQVPGIGSEHGTAVLHGQGRWLWVLLAVLFVNAVLLVFLLWPQTATTPHSGPVESADASAQAEPQPRRWLPPPSPPAAKPVPAPTRQLQPQIPAIPATVTVPLRPLPPLTEPVTPDEVGTSGGVSPSAGGSVIHAVRPVSQAASAHNDDNLPVWPQISGQLMSELNGSLHLDVHVYSDIPGERFVLINMRKYREGGKLQEGPVVSEITPDSVILSFHGQRFRMQSQ